MMEKDGGEEEDDGDGDGGNEPSKESWHGGLGWPAELAGLRDGKLTHLSLQRELHMGSALVRKDEVVFF